MNTLERIQSLITVLPEKDIQLAEQFIKKREFESLYELVSSDIYKVRKKAKQNNIEEIDIPNLGDLDLLKSEIVNYIDTIGWYEEELKEEYEEF